MTEQLKQKVAGLDHSLRRQHAQLSQSKAALAFSQQQQQQQQVVVEQQQRQLQQQAVAMQQQAAASAAAAAAERRQMSIVSAAEATTTTPGGGGGGIELGEWLASPTISRALAIAEETPAFMHRQLGQAGGGGGHAAVAPSSIVSQAFAAQTPAAVPLDADSTSTLPSQASIMQPHHQHQQQLAVAAAAAAELAQQAETPARNLAAMLDDDDGTADDPDSTAAVAENSEAILRVAEAVAMLQIKFDQREKERELDYQAQKEAARLTMAGGGVAAATHTAATAAPRCRSATSIGSRHSSTSSPQVRALGASGEGNNDEEALWTRPLKALPHASPRKAVSPKRTNNPSPRSSPAYAWLY